MTNLIGATLAVAMTGAMVSADTVIDKQPDLGSSWWPLGNRSTYIFASDFIVPDGETTATQLGIWLEPDGGSPYAVIALELWGGDQVSGPDWDDVIATTDDFTATSAGLNLYVLDVVNQVRNLVPGEVCWLVANGWERGDRNYTSYYVGGHTPNSVYPDNGTFWCSNDPASRYFDCRSRTPQMAFQVFLGGGISLSITGDCPGVMEVCMRGNDAGDRCAIIYGFGTGSGPTVPGCPGLNVDILGPTIAAVGNANAAGDFCASGRVPQGACGRTFVQGVNVTQCALTGVEGL